MEKDLFFKGCGTDSGEAKEFAKKMFSKIERWINAMLISNLQILFILIARVMIM